MKLCKNGHTVHEDAFQESDQSCMFCGGFVWTPTRQDLKELEIDEFLYYPQSKLSTISGMATSLKHQYKQVYECHRGKITRLR
jgi:hypothetical protein